MAVLDVEAVQAFLAIADHQSFTRAAKQLGTTQGAISVKLKRLEDRLGQRLLERTPRTVRLSAQGAQFVEFARDFVAAHNRALAGLSSGRRRFSLGIATHVAGPEVPTVLARLNAHDPALRMEVELDNSAALLGALDHGTIDAAILRRDDDRRDGAVLAPEPFGWYAAPDFAHRPGAPLRLASTAPSCGVRNIAARALDAAGIAWTEIFLGCSPLVADAVTAGRASPSPTPGCNRFTSSNPRVRETRLAQMNQPTARTPIRPSAPVSPICAMPATRVAKTSGAMIILIRLRKTVVMIWM